MRALHTAVSRLYTPRTHQGIITDYCWDHRRCNIWAHPGMGKTAANMKLFDLLALCGSAFFPALIVAPLAVARDVWLGESQKWADFQGIRVVPIIGSTPAARHAALLLRGDVYTINYENLVWLQEHFGDKWPFKIVIADESTKLRGYRLKGQGGKRASALGKVAHLTGRWINLTGTPSPHGLESLWGQQWFVDFGSRLGHSYTDFIKRWFIVDPYTKAVVPRDNTRAEIYAALADCAIAFRVEDWLPIEKPAFFEKRVNLPPDARVHYHTMEKKFFAELPADVKIIAWAEIAKSGKLLQMAAGSVYDENHVAHFVHDAKLEALRSLYDELGEPLVVVYHFNFDRDRICKEFPEARVYKAKADQDLWNAGKLPMLLIHPKSAGHGIDLQYGGRAIAFFSNDWDLELRQQVIERLGPARQLQAGFKRTVLIYDIIANNTMDENVNDRLMGRATEQDALMAARARSAA